MAEFRGGLATLSIGSGDMSSSPVFTKAGQLMDLAGPNLQADMIEVTDRDDTFKRFIYGQIDAGEVTFSLNFDPGVTEHGTGAGSYRKLQADGDITAFRIILPGTDTETVTFDGLVSGFAETAPTNDVLSADVTIKISGEPIYA